ncbi:hypothetical protein C8Q74DRAFT_1362865 [Fomes fomentarius]|nr:hypothetical protein C8Q74DRAFT_1362865 [Fomes fomentarius]
MTSIPKFDPRPFTFGDIPAISTYLDRMDAYLSAALHNHLKKEYPLNLVLVKPEVPTRQFARAIPPLPFGVETTYVLKVPLQTGVDCKAQVWLAEPQARECDITDDGKTKTQVLFKFIAPSHRDAGIPMLPMDKNGVMRLAHCRYEHPFTIATRAVAAYDALLEFQGLTVPYMYGVFEVKIPWEEQAWVLALEYINGSASLDRLKVTEAGPEVPEGLMKYQDFSLYRKIFVSAWDTHRTAHGKKILHGDLHNSSNILVDEANDLMVLIDWGEYCEEILLA